MSPARATPPDLILHGGKVITLDGRSTVAAAIAIQDERIVALGTDAEIAQLAGPQTRRLDLRGRTAMPGLIDGHAHLDREGLKRRLPSLAGIGSIAELVTRLKLAAARVAPGEWVVTMPLGDPPEHRVSPQMFSEGRLPDRHDLDQASREHPILIRPAWGYWSRQIPVVGIANTRALELAGITKDSVSPSPQLVIERDTASGEPTGRFFEHLLMPLAEFTLFAMAPNFTLADREAALPESMRLYNAVGTTSVFEGHGVAPEVIAAYQKLRAANRQTVRAQLVFSPSWRSTRPDDVRALLGSWGSWLARRGFGDAWLRVAGLYTEIDEKPESRLRAALAPTTGWAGFCYDAGLPREAVKALMIECARNGIRVCGIWAELLELYAEVDRIAPIGGSRWVLGHQSVLDAEQIRRIKDLGVVLTLHTNAHIYKRGGELRAQVGRENEDRIVPLRQLLDAGIVVALGSDNVPPSLFRPIWQAVARRDRAGDPVAPSQAISREEALRCATASGAWLTFEETEKGTLEPGKLADLIVLPENPLDVPLERLKDLAPDLTLVGGRIVYERAAPDRPPASMP